jgi:hypothetical protein
MRARDLIAWGVLPGLLTPGVAPADWNELSASEAEMAMHGTFNNGEDLTRPRNMFQVRQRYERLPDAEGREPEKWVTTLRADLRTSLGGGWKLYGRIDEPLVYSDDVTSRFNPNGHSRFGPGRPADRGCYDRPTTDGTHRLRRGRARRLAHRRPE